MRFQQAKSRVSLRQDNARTQGARLKAGFERLAILDRSIGDALATTAPSVKSSCHPPRLFGKILRQSAQ